MSVRTKICASCNATIGAFAQFCPECGEQQAHISNSYNQNSSGRSKLAAGLIAILLGGLGIHKFYLGQPGMGVVYLLFCWTFIPAIIGFIEGLIYLTMDQQKFLRQYG